MSQDGSVNTSQERKTNKSKPSNRQEQLQSFDKSARSSRNNKLRGSGMAGYSKTSKKNQLKTLRKRRLQVAEFAPEAHFVGELVGGVGFDSGVSCKWMIQAGEGWEPLDGNFVDKRNVTTRLTKVRCVCGHIL